MRLRSVIILALCLCVVAYAPAKPLPVQVRSMSVGQPVDWSPLTHAVTAREAWFTALPPAAATPPAPRLRRPSGIVKETMMDGERVSSTAYCLTGTMANGSVAHRGAVAANRWPLGTRLRVSDSPGVGEIVTVEDRIGSGSELDFALPGDCGGARSWGRRSISVEVV